MLSLTTLEVVVAIAAGSIVIGVSFYKLYRFIVKGKVDKTLKDSRQNNRLRNIEDSLEAFQNDMDSALEELQHIKESTHEDHIKRAQLEQVVSTLSDAVKELDTDMRDIIKMLMGMQG